MLAIPKVFNDLSLSAYVALCFDICEGRVQRCQDFTVLHICTSHIIHATARLLKKLPGLTPSQYAAAMRCFGVLLCSQTLDEAAIAFEQMFLLFNSKHTSKETEEAIGALETFNFSNYPKFTSIPDEENEDVLYYALKQKRRSLKEKSPFSGYFKNIQDRIQFKPSTSSQLNEYYNPKIFHQLTKHIHLLPLCSGIMLRRFGNQRDTNAAVESWFAYVKQSILQHKCHTINETVDRLSEASNLRCAAALNLEILESRTSTKGRGKEFKKETWKRRRGSKSNRHLTTGAKLPVMPSKSTLPKQSKEKRTKRKLEASIAAHHFERKASKVEPLDRCPDPSQDDVRLTGDELDIIRESLPQVATQDDDGVFFNLWSSS